MTFQYTIRNFKGETLTGSEGNAVSDPYGAVEIFDIDTDSIKNAFDTREIYLQVDVNSKNKISARDIYFFGDPKDLALPVVDASVSTKQTGDKLNITLGSDQLVKNVYLWIDGFEGHFSDNYFDLLPGEEITVSIDIPGDKKIADQDIHMLTMNTILNKYKEDK